MYDYTPDQTAANMPVTTSYFYGLNRTRKGTRGEFEDMANMSAREFPCAAPRGARVKICDVENVQAVCAPDVTDTAEITGFTGIADEQFLYNGVVKSGTVKLHTKYKWSIIRLGNLYVMNGYCDSPKKSVMYYYNIDTKVFAAAGTRTDNLIVTAGSDSTGSYLATIRFGHDAVMDYAVTNAEGDEIKNSDFFKKYAGNRKTIGADNIFEAVFKPGDEVTISGFPTTEQSRGEVWYYHTSNENVVPYNNYDYSGNNTVDTDVYTSLDSISRYAPVTAYVKSFKTTGMSVSGNATHIHYIYFDLYNKNGDAASFDDMSTGSYRVYCSGVTVSKRARCFNHIAAHHGRIWGTMPTGNMIYASASDDIFSFTSSDISAGYAARLTSDSEGGFTGICEYGSDVIAFKENSIAVIYGSGVSSYRTENVCGIGCIDPASIAVTPSGVIFLAHKGFYLYNGTASPSRFSDKLNCRYITAVGGFDGILYYASATRADGGRELVVYDTSRSTWHLHDDMSAVAFFPFRGRFYIADAGGLYEQTDTPGSDEWSFTSVKATDSTLDNKAVNEIWILCDMAEGAYIKVWTSVDNGAFVMHRAFAEPGLGVIRCPVRVKNGTIYRYKITGAGYVVFYNIEIRKAESEGRNHTEKAVSRQSIDTY